MNESTFVRVNALRERGYQLKHLVQAARATGNPQWYVVFFWYRKWSPLVTQLSHNLQDRERVGVIGPEMWASLDDDSVAVLEVMMTICEQIDKENTHAKDHTNTPRPSSGDGVHPH